MLTKKVMDKFLYYLQQEHNTQTTWRTCNVATSHAYQSRIKRIFALAYKTAKAKAGLGEKVTDINLLRDALDEAQFRIIAINNPHRKRSIKAQKQAEYIVDRYKCIYEAIFRTIEAIKLKEEHREKEENHE